MEKLSKEQESRVMRALESAVDMINDGTSPTDALHKVAEENRFTPQLIQRAAEALNTSRSLAHFKSASGSDRAADFDLADATVVTERMYPATLVPEGEKAAAVNIPLAYQHKESTCFMKSARTLAPLPVLEKPAAYNRCEVTHARRLIDRRDGLRKAAAAAKSDYRIEFHRLLKKAEAVADYFRHLDHAPFEMVERKAISEFGKTASFCMGIVHQLAGLTEKRAELGDVKSQLIFDYNRQPYKAISEMMDQAVLVTKKASDANATEDAYVNYEIEHGLREKPAPVVDVFAAGPLPFAKAAFDPAGTALDLGQNALGLKDNAGDSAKRDAIGEVFNPEHEAALQSASVKAMLNDFISNDPIISGYDPQHVATAYNQLAQLTPRVAQQPAVMRGMLRKVLQQEGVMEPFEAGQMADIEKKLNTGKEQDTEGLLVNK